MDNFKGKTAVVTGSASGIGRGLASALAKKGANVVLADIEGAKARDAAEEVAAQSGAKTLGLACDVSDIASFEALADQAYEAFGRVDLLCNNAGVLTGGPVQDLKLTDAQWLFSVNVFGVIHGCRVFLPRMIEQGGPAHILNTASETGLAIPTGQGHLGVYCATKHAVIGFSDALRHEAAESGIGVSILCPGGVRTNLLSAARNRPDQFGGTDAALPPGGNVLEQVEMVPDTVAALALAGIARGDFYIVTDIHSRNRAQNRCEEIDAAFEKLPS